MGEEGFSHVLCSRDFIHGFLPWKETGWWAAQRKLVLGSSPTPVPQVSVDAAFFSGRCPPAPPNSSMPLNKCICPLAKIPVASQWGRCRAGWGTIPWKEIRVSVRGGWGKAGPLLTHILASPWAADLRSLQPQVSVSALSSELPSPGEGVLPWHVLWRQPGWRGEGGFASLLGAVDPRKSAGACSGGCWGLSGEMGRVRQPQTRLHSSQHACWGLWG